MNFNIQQLIYQASEEVWDESPLNGSPEFQGHKLNEEQFAKLLVQKCVKICELVANMAVIANEGEMARKCEATANSCAKMIKQTFGVEE